MNSDVRVVRHLFCLVVLMNGCAFGTDLDGIEVDSADETVDSADEELIYGRFDFDRANDFVVLVDEDHDEDGLLEAGCTGVLITPRSILTSPECFPSPTSSFHDAKEWYPIPFEPHWATASGVTSGVKTSSRIVMSVDRRIQGFDISLPGASSASTLDACRSLCAASTSCEGFSFDSRARTCQPKRSGIRIRFGSSLASAPTFSVRATRYSRPEKAEFESRVALLHLERAVPSSIATPVPVLTSFDGSLLRQRVRALGFGGSPIRQTAEGEIVGVRPLNLSQNHDVIQVRFDVNALFEDGDEGSALLLWSHGRWNLLGAGFGRYRGTTPIFTSLLTRASMHLDEVAHWLEHHLVDAAHSDRDGRLIALDLSGEGRSDVLCHDQVSGHLRAMWANAEGSLQNDTRFGSPFCVGESMLAGDFDGDGDEDVLCVRHGEFQVEVSHASSAGYLVSSHLGRALLPCAGLHAGHLLVADTDGDGRDELLCHDTNYGNLEAHDVLTGLGYTWRRRSPDFCAREFDRLYVGDFNRDGRDDLLCHSKHTGERRIEHANSSGHYDWSSYGDVEGSSWCSGRDTMLHIGDFDGDRRADMMCRNTQTGAFEIDRASNGFNGTDWRSATGWCTHPGAALVIADFNGDRRDDLLCHTDSDGYLAYDYAAAGGVFGGTDHEVMSGFCLAKRPAPVLSLNVSPSLRF